MKTWNQIENEHMDKIIERSKRNLADDKNSFEGIGQILENSIDVALLYGNLDKTKCMYELQHIIDFCQRTKNKLL